MFSQGIIPLFIKVKDIYQDFISKTTFEKILCKYLHYLYNYQRIKNQKIMNILLLEIKIIYRYKSNAIVNTKASH